jgi:hypothetical protein
MIAHKIKTISGNRVSVQGDQLYLEIMFDGFRDVTFWDGDKFLFMIEESQVANPKIPSLTFCP